ncbi:hypothetical protein N2W54_007953 [Lotmaria passim]
MPAKPNTSGEQIVEVDPLGIYFTFSRIRPRFSCGRTIESTLQQFRDGELQPRDLPLLAVLTNGTHYFSQNNRRLYTYKQLKREGLLDVVPVRLRPFPQTKRMENKYTPETCSLTATLMRDIDKSTNSSSSVAAATVGQAEKVTADNGAESGATPKDQREDEGKGEGGVRGNEAAQATAAPSPPHMSPQQQTAEKKANFAERREDRKQDDGAEAEARFSRKQKKKKSTQQQQQQQQQRRGTKGHGRRGGASDSEDEEGGTNSLEAELRKLGLQ